MENEKRLIDATQLIKRLEAMKYDTDAITIDGIIRALKEPSTVDAVEVVHGKWEMGLDEGDYEYGTCSVCGYNEYNAFGCLLPHNYCPNCGAKMDGGNEDG